MTSWYNSRYAPWRALRQPSYLAQADTNLSRAATALHNGPADNNANGSKDKKPQDSLFGPNIGVVSSGPSWTATTEKKVLTDELTPEVVANWVERSKDASQPTTTLQALVNLKRPTLRLSPLSSNDSQTDQAEPAHHYHGLEFEYDCDAPKCGLYVHVFLPKDHPDAPESAPSSGMSKLLVFENVTEGGFGKLLKLEQGAMLELDRFEHIPPASSASGSGAPTASSPSGPGVDTSSSTVDGPGTSEGAAAPASSSARNRLRFTHFNFRRRDNNHSVSGPALAVVDAEPASNPAAADAATPAANTKGKEDSAEGVKVIIRLVALDEQGTELASPNEQVTYLHIVRFGNKAEDAEDSEDTRPWVVKVVKREATIGPHTFHLHEIYGLSSQSTSAHDHAPTAALPTSTEGDSHTYPPAAPAVQHDAAAEDDPSSECLLCLSSPREVVLLPCRHLVACKDCALNMVEFGAGGNITQPEEPAAAPEPTPAAATGEASATGAAPVAPGTPAVPTPSTPVVTTAAPTRRKRKAKGWFCPVCRQPYTSLLRITTNPPAPNSDPAAAEEQNKEAISFPLPATTEPLSNGTLPVTTADVSQPASEASVERNGSLMSRSRNLTPSFLRSLSFNRSQAPGDVESQTPPQAQAAAARS